MPSSPKLYDTLAHLWSVFSPPADYAEEADTFRQRLGREGVPDGASVLHLGSGGGSLDFNLKRWYRVTGVDLSPAMLEQAAALNPEVEYVEGDIRNVRLDRRFDAVLVHDAISYMTSTEELDEVYRSAAAHLSAGGVLIALPEELRDRLKERETSVWSRQSGDLVLNVMEASYDADPADHVFEVVYVFLIRRGDDLRVEVDRHVNGVFELDEFLGAVRKAGFRADAEEWDLSEWEEEPEMPLIVGVRT